MRRVSDRVRFELMEEPDVCARRHEGGCGGRITWEHALKYKGRQIDAVWAIIKLCERHHDVGFFQDRGVLDKEKNVWIALNRATDEELNSYEKAGFAELKARLNNKYGVPL